MHHLLILLATVGWLKQLNSSAVNASVAILCELIFQNYKILTHPYEYVFTPFQPFFYQYEWFFFNSRRGSFIYFLSCLNRKT